MKNSSYRVTDMDTMQCNIFTGSLSGAVEAVRETMFKEIDCRPRMRVCIVQGESLVWSENETVSALDKLNH